MAKSKSSKPAAPARSFNPKFAPRKRTFRFANHSKPQSRVPKDDRTIKRSAPQLELVRPAWEGQNPTTFRPYPAFCPDDPSIFDPTLLSSDTFDISDWCRGIAAVKYIGLDQKVTFLLYDPRDENYDRNSNPYIVLYNAIRSAVEEGEARLGSKNYLNGKWAPLVMRDSKKRAFNDPTKLFFLQGAVFEHGDEVFVKGGGLPKGLRDGDLPQIVQVTKTAGESLTKQMGQTVDGYNGDTDDLGAYFVHGNLTDLAKGEFVTFYNPDKHDVGPAEDDEGEADAGGDEKGSSREFKGWRTYISPKFSYTHKRKNFAAKPDISEYEEIIRDRMLWWDDVLHFPETEEMCVWIAQAFKSMPKLMQFGWADNPEFFTGEVKSILAARTIDTVSDTGSDDEDEDEVEDIDVEEEEKPRKPVKKTSAAIPDEDPEDLTVDDDDEDEAEDVSDDDEDLEDDAADDEEEATDDAEEVEDDDVDDEDEDVLEDDEEEFDADEYEDVPPKKSKKPAPKAKKPEDDDEDLTDEEADMEAAIEAAEKRAEKRPVPKKVAPPVAAGKSAANGKKAKPTGKKSK